MSASGDSFSMAKRDSIWRILFHDLYQYRDTAHYTSHMHWKEVERWQKEEERWSTVGISSAFLAPISSAVLGATQLSPVLEKAEKLSKLTQVVRPLCIVVAVVGISLQSTYTWYMNYVGKKITKSFALCRCSYKYYT